jgi:hypothetical protein
VVVARRSAVVAARRSAVVAIVEPPSVAAIVEPPSLAAIVEVTAAIVEVTAAIVEVTAAITAAAIVEVTAPITAEGGSPPVQPSELSPALRRQAPIIRMARRRIAAITPIHPVRACDEA